MYLCLRKESFISEYSKIINFLVLGYVINIVFMMVFFII